MALVCRFRRPLPAAIAHLIVNCEGMKKAIIILGVAFVTAQITLVAAPIQPLDFRVPAGMPDATQILSPADIFGLR